MAAFTNSPAAPSCAGPTEPHEYYPEDTNPHNRILESYYFVINHLDGTVTTVCNLFGPVRAGDAVTAHFTLSPYAAAAKSTQLTLVSYVAPTPVPLSVQRQSDCAWFANDDHDSHDDNCRLTAGTPKEPTSNAQQQLTVTVPNCNGFQIDFIYREVGEKGHIRSGRYGRDHHWITGMAGNRRAHSCVGGGGDPTPTPTPTGASPSVHQHVRGGSGTGRFSTTETGRRGMRLRLTGLPQIPHRG